jgi:hypothetical protein
MIFASVILLWKEIEVLLLQYRQAIISIFFYSLSRSSENEWNPFLWNIISLEKEHLFGFVLAVRLGAMFLAMLAGIVPESWLISV